MSGRWCGCTIGGREGRYNVSYALETLVMQWSEEKSSLEEYN